VLPVKILCYGTTSISSPSNAFKQYSSLEYAPENDVPKHFFQAQTFAQTFALSGNDLDEISCVFNHDIYLQKA